MISYLKAKNDLDIIIEYNNAVLALWDIENKSEDELSRGYNHFILHSEKKQAIDELSSQDPSYQEVRANVSKYVLDAMKIGRKHKIPLEFKSIPPPMVGGAIIPVNIFQSVLFDSSYQGVSKQMVVDAIRQTIGSCEKKIKDEFINLINPLSWIKFLIVTVLRIPFVLIESTGFNVSKVEDHLFGKVFKLIEIIFIFFVMYKFGFEKSEIAQSLKAMLVK